MNEFLSLWFGNFQLIRRYVGGLWIIAEVPEIEFSNWVKLDDQLANAFDRFDCGKKLKHEDYRK